MIGKSMLKVPPAVPYILLLPVVQWEGVQYWSLMYNTEFFRIRHQRYGVWRVHFRGYLLYIRGTHLQQFLKAKVAVWRPIFHKSVAKSHWQPLGARGEGPRLTILYIAVTHSNDKGCLTSRLSDREFNHGSGVNGSFSNKWRQCRPYRSAQTYEATA